ncbi:MAG: hypothetical protein KDA85_22125, partial [Planctomycetaceae bacterium]|nr:hypothetical protein [Planctomycetaceae bacterium]
RKISRYDSPAGSLVQRAPTVTIGTLPRHRDGQCGEFPGDLALGAVGVIMRNSDHQTKWGAES